MSKEVKKITLDNLALMVAKGFNDMNEKVDNGFKELRSEFKSDIKRLEADINEVKSDLSEVKSDTEDIKAELNKKVDKFTHNELEYRVEKLEKKFA